MTAPTARYYRLALVLPVAVPVAALPVMLLAPPRSMAAGAAAYAVYSLYFGGVPYLVLVVGLLWWSRDRPVAEVRRAILAAPAAMLPLQWVWTAVYAVLEEGPTGPGAVAGAAVFLSWWVLGFGYAYVALVEGVAAVRRRRARSG